MPTTAEKKPTAKKVTTRKPTVRKTVAKPVAEKVAHHVISKPTTPHAKTTYIFAVGRRKEAVARVRWHANDAPAFTVNGRPMTQYFPTLELQFAVMQPLVATNNTTVGNMTAKVNGGGVAGQAEAVRLGIARALVKGDPDLRLVLKRAGFMRRDPRAKERKKYGLKRARRAPQWQKR